MAIPPQQLDFPSLAFPKDRSVLTVGEVAAKWNVSDRHVVDLIEEGKLVAFDIAGRRDYVRAPMTAIDEIAKRTGLKSETLLEIIRGARPTLRRSPSFYRIPVLEGFTAFMKENHSQSGARK